MAMNFKWGGTTWSLGTSDLPDSPLNMGLDQNGQIYRNIGGTGVHVLNWSRESFAFRWTDGSVAVRDYVKGMAKHTSTIVWEGTEGTFTTNAVPGSYSAPASGYLVYDVRIILKEV